VDVPQRVKVSRTQGELRVWVLSVLINHLRWGNHSPASYPAWGQAGIIVGTT